MSPRVQSVLGAVKRFQTRHPGEGLFTLTLRLIVFFMVEGISKPIFALTIRPFPN
jgi:uncharacterized membrane protein HdeD (DUF308 family)